MSYVIGVDVGSQSVKAVLFDETGTAVQGAAAPYEMTCPRSGWAEQDPISWERGIARTVRELRQRSRVAANEVEMLALASQVDGLVALDGAVIVGAAAALMVRPTLSEADRSSPGSLTEIDSDSVPE